MLKLSTICNECVLNVSNFYAFKQRILCAQKALAECAEIESQHDADLLETKNNEMHISYEDLTDETNPIENHGSNEGAATTDGDKGHEIDNEVEFLILQDPDPVDKKEETIVVATEKNTQIATRRRNPSKRKKVEDTLATEKVAIQVNECLVCPAVLSDILELNDHAAAHTSVDCKVCHRSFVRYANLKRHFLTAHSKPKPFVCDLCGLGFSFSVNLQTHASLHYSGKIQTKNMK